MSQASRKGLDSYMEVLFLYAGGIATYQMDALVKFGASSGTAKLNINGNVLIGNGVQGTRSPPSKRSFWSEVELLKQQA